MPLSHDSWNGSIEGYVSGEILPSENNSPEDYKENKVIGDENEGSHSWGDCSTIWSTLSHDESEYRIPCATNRQDIIENIKEEKSQNRVHLSAASSKIFSLDV